MISILTQSKAIINIDKITTISAAIDETHDNKIAVVADQSYVLGYYDNENVATEVIIWIANTIGSHCNDINLCLTMPTFNEENTDAETN